MIHHERLRPPVGDYPADEWNVIEKRYNPEFLAQLETMMALGNGYLGMRGCPEEGAPAVEDGTLVNGFYETRPIEYGEAAYGFPKTGQTICNVADSKTIKLFVDDEPFLIPNADILAYDRRLNMKSGTLDREILWETPSGKKVSVTSRRLVSFVDRHVAAISYCVTVLDGEASLVVSSEMGVDAPAPHTSAEDPRLARVFAGPVLQYRNGYSKDRRVVLCHTTRHSRLTVVSGIDHVLETDCPNTSKTVQNENFGQVAFTVAAKPGCAVHLTKWMVYHTSDTATDLELCGRAEWTLDRVVSQGSSTRSPARRAIWMTSGGVATCASGTSGRSVPSAPLLKSSKRSASTSFKSCRRPPAQRAPASRPRASPDGPTRDIISGTPKSICFRSWRTPHPRSRGVS
jgi:alpha,alpha-trehalose phosphorylase